MNGSSGDTAGEPRQHRGGGRSLQRQQCPVIERLDGRAAAETLAQMGEIAVLARGVDDDEQPVAEPGRHQIVEDAARIVE